MVVFSRESLFPLRHLFRHLARLALQAGLKCVEAMGRIIIIIWGAGVVVCLEQGADNSMIYT